MDNKELPWKRFYTLDPQVFPPVNGDWDETATIRDGHVNPGGRLLRPGEVSRAPRLRFSLKGRFGEVDVAALQRQPILHLCSEAAPLYDILWHCQGYGT